MPTLLTAVALGAPLIASVLVAVLGQALGKGVANIAISALVVSALSALLSLHHVIVFKPIVVTLPGFSDWLAPTLLVDRLGAVMMVLITGVSLVIHVYSRRYMQNERGYAKFFAVLSLLNFVLLALVTSAHLIWLLVWWHAVTWLLKTLLSFNDQSTPARQAGWTTVRVLAVGDAALLVGILLLYSAFGTFDLTQILALVKEGPIPTFGTGTWWEVPAVQTITLVLVLSIITKSAQFPFHIWLLGTIEAPTPVSAMLHAGIVNAGGFLVNRLAPLFEASPSTLHFLFFIGGFTALVGACTMLTQTSIKRRLVYSTMGQMGYMVMECGLGAFALAIFHLCAHGLFKATLFLNSGTPIHKARTDYHLPAQHTARHGLHFSLLPWATGLAITLVLPLLILLIAHGLVNVPLFEAQGTTIFLFFAWVTSAQAIFSLYRIQALSSWKVSGAMIVALFVIVLTYVWAGESFTHFLYSSPGEASAYFEAAAWSQALFETFVALSAVAIIAVWAILYGQAHSSTLLLPTWLKEARQRLYVLFFNALYVEDLLHMLNRPTPRSPRRPS
jgi:NADH-quinone oxidoreductase subunit L